jgi:hypothetical protein
MRICRKKTGPRESSLIKSESSAKSGASVISAGTDSAKSSARFDQLPVLKFISGEPETWFWVTGK